MIATIGSTDAWNHRSAFRNIRSCSKSLRLRNSLRLFAMSTAHGAFLSVMALMTYVAVGCFVKLRFYWHLLSTSASGAKNFPWVGTARCDPQCKEMEMVAWHRRWLMQVTFLSELVWRQTYLSVNFEFEETKWREETRAKSNPRRNRQSRFFLLAFQEMII